MLLERMCQMLTNDEKVEIIKINDEKVISKKKEFVQR